MKDQLISKIQQLKQKAADIEKEINILRIQLSELNAPVKLGDKIEYQYGKQTKQAIVEAIDAGPYGFNSYRLICRRILKNGDMGEQFSLSHFDKVSVI